MLDKVYVDCDGFNISQLTRHNDQCPVHFGVAVADYDVYQPCYQSALHDAIIHQCDSYTYDIRIRSLYHILQCR